MLREHLQKEYKPNQFNKKVVAQHIRPKTKSNMFAQLEEHFNNAAQIPILDSCYLPPLQLIQTAEGKEIMIGSLSM